MTTFRTGWYEVHFEAKTFRSRCRYFRTMAFYTAECVVESNGQQILLWEDSSGPTGPGRPAQWSEAFRALANAGDGDWWDNPPGGLRYKPALPGDFSRVLRKPTPRELCQRVGAGSAANALSCSKEINVGIFFDGTDNNLRRDKPKSHSNVVSLFDAHKLDRTENFAYYIPGVGTKFPQIGEFGEDANGKKFAAGGEQRIHYAMLQVYNAVCRAATGSELMYDDEMKEIVTTVGGLATWYRLSDNRMNAVFERIDARLMKAIEGTRPRISELNLSVFGFSRGAAESRTFTKWIQEASRMRVGTAILKVKFLGIFDTVASVLLPDSAPAGLGDGLFDWARGTLEIAGPEHTAHYVAAHEIRRSFPLSTARSGKSYSSGVKEFVYPGAHSNIGGGYEPGFQGKSTGGRSTLLSQIPLNDMYFEAVNAGAALFAMTKMPGETRADFKIDSKLDASFSAYAAWTKYREKEDVAAANGDPTQNRLQDHTHMYWRWRASVSPDAKFKALSSYAASKEQDKTDLWESELDWRADIENARKASKPSKMFVRGLGEIDVPPTANGVQKSLLVEIGLSTTVSASVGDFFDNFVHDSHGGFWMLGARTELDRTVFIREIKDKQRVHDRLLAMAHSSAVTNPAVSLGFFAAAKAYELNKFELRVLVVDAKTPGDLPTMSDADAPDLRKKAGPVTSVILAAMGTATRREPHGHGRYRTVFDHS